MSNHDQKIYDMVCRIPHGRVATYGQIARLLQRPNSARQIGYALARLYDTDDVPWHRVVNARGEISARSKSGCEDLQHSLLEDEGVSFNCDGRIDLSRFLWAGD